MSLRRVEGSRRGTIHHRLSTRSSESRKKSSSHQAIKLSSRRLIMLIFIVFMTYKMYYMRQNVLAQCKRLRQLRSVISIAILCVEQLYVLHFMSGDMRLFGGVCNLTYAKRWRISYDAWCIYFEHRQSMCVVNFHTVVVGKFHRQSCYSFVSLHAPIMR